MLDLGWTELLLVAVVALIVVGPNELPGVLRTVTGLMRRARAMTREFQRGIEDMARDSGVDEIKRDLQNATSAKDDGLDDLLGPAPGLDDKADPAASNSIFNPTKPTSTKPKARGSKARGPKARDTKARDTKARGAEVNGNGAAEPVAKAADNAATTKDDGAGAAAPAVEKTPPEPASAALGEAEPKPQ